MKTRMRTHCKNGHALIEENRYLYNGYVSCKTCRSVNAHVFNERNPKRTAKYDKENKDKVRKRQRTYVQEHREMLIESRKKYYKDNREILSEKHRVYNGSNAAKEAGRNSKYLKKYGITLGMYNAMLVEQSNKCAICKHDQIAGWYLSVDHDHVTGQVRGLLCYRCNSALGFLREDPILLSRALEYLSKSKSSYGGQK